MCLLGGILCFPHLTCHSPWSFEAQDVCIVENPGNLLSPHGLVAQQALPGLAGLAPVVDGELSSQHVGPQFANERVPA